MASTISEAGSTISSSSDSEAHQANASGGRWRGIAVALGVAVIAISGSNIAGAYVRGNAAASAAVRNWEKAQAEYNPSALLAQALSLRAGRGAGSNRQVENTAFEWARKLQVQEGVAPAQFNDSALTAQAVPVDNNNMWGEEWLKVEVNRVLAGAKDTINEKMAEYLQDPSLVNGLPMVEWQHGLESMIINDVSCPWVKVNTNDGTAYIGVMITAATQGPLGCGGHLMGDKYPFTLKVSKIWWSARHADVDVRLGMPFAFTSVKSGWIQGGIGNLEGVCYGKTGGSEDDACTGFMNKKLNKEKGAMVLKMSQTLTQMMQQKLNSFMSGFMSYDYDYDSNS
jgi:hypothetical protein